MKTHLPLSATVAAILLTATSFAQAGTPAHAKKHTAVRSFDRNAYTEAVITRDQQSAQNQDQVGGEIGNNAPHEERNPSDHPELFRTNR